MDYDKKSDSYICKNEKLLPFTHFRRSKSKIGYAVPQIFKLWHIECSCRKCFACNGKKRKQTS